MNNLAEGEAPGRGRDGTHGVISLVTFDLDDTLWDCSGVIDAAEAALYTWLQCHYPRITEQFTRAGMVERRAELRAERPDLAHDVTALRRAALHWHARQAGYPEIAAEAALRVFLAARHQVTPFGDVAPTLARLAGRYRLAALTNGNADVYRLGLGAYFAFSLSPEHVGVAKPDPEIFRKAADLARVPSAHVVHVGDHLDHDIAGARDAGLRVIWLNRPGLGRDVERFCGDAEAHDLTAVERILDAWNGQTG